MAFFFGKKFPLVCSHHGDWSPFFKAGKRKGLRKLKDLIEIQVEKLLLNRIDHFFLGDFFQIPFLAQASHNVSYTIFSSGLDLQKMLPIPKKTAREKLGWDNNKKYILYVGKLYEFKQPKELIDIWKGIKKENPEVELVVIGNSKSDKYYDYTIESGVMVLGRILNTELNIYYSASDVYVLMALRDDYFGGTGIAPLESLACNTPVVSYSMRNYVGDNMHELGEVPDSINAYKEAIKKVLYNSGLYKNMRESMEKYYSLEAVASRVRKIYDELLIKYKIN
jgi:glycosyltransferase involved in cell wall biosynthesis